MSGCVLGGGEHYQFEWIFWVLLAAWALLVPRWPLRQWIPPSWYGQLVTFLLLLVLGIQAFRGG